MYLEAHQKSMTAREVNRQKYRELQLLQDDELNDSSLLRSWSLARISRMSMLKYLEPDERKAAIAEERKREREEEEEMATRREKRVARRQELESSMLTTPDRVPVSSSPSTPVRSRANVQSSPVVSSHGESPGAPRDPSSPLPQPINISIPSISAHHSICPLPSPNSAATTPIIPDPRLQVDLGNINPQTGLVMNNK